MKAVVTTVALIAVIGIAFLWAHRKPVPNADPLPAAITASAQGITPIGKAPAWWSKWPYPVVATLMDDGRIVWKGESFAPKAFGDRVRQWSEENPILVPAGPFPGNSYPTVEILMLNFESRTLASPAERSAADILLAAVTSRLEEVTGWLVSANAVVRNPEMVRQLQVSLNPVRRLSGNAVEVAARILPYEGSGAADYLATQEAGHRYDWAKAYEMAVSAGAKGLSLEGVRRDKLPWSLASTIAANQRDWARALDALKKKKDRQKNPTPQQADMNQKLQAAYVETIAQEAKRPERLATVALARPRYLIAKWYPVADGAAIIGPAGQEIAWFPEHGPGRLGPGVVDIVQVGSPTPITNPMPALDAGKDPLPPKPILVEVIVGTDGAVASAWAVKETNSTLERIAVGTVAKRKFRPSIRDGTPVSVRMVVPVTFQER